jgi:hypothetical protein
MHSRVNACLSTSATVATTDAIGMEALAPIRFCGSGRTLFEACVSLSSLMCGGIGHSDRDIGYAQIAIYRQHMLGQRATATPSPLFFRSRRRAPPSDALTRFGHNLSNGGVSITRGRPEGWSMDDQSLNPEPEHFRGVAEKLRGLAAQIPYDPSQGSAPRLGGRVRAVCGSFSARVCRRIAVVRSPHGLPNSEPHKRALRSPRSPPS